MNIQSVSCVYFSPTGTTRTITEHIAQGTAAQHIEQVDFTKRSLRAECPLAFSSDLVILATPVYYGRVPKEAVSHLTTLTGRQTPAVLVVVYGNREFEDALIELRDIALAAGFVPVAGAAFIAEHSFSSAACPIAQGRPDDKDLVQAKKFGVEVRKKLRHLESPASAGALTVPGNVPYQEARNLAMIMEARKTTALTPETDTTLCSQCGQCAEACPTGAIAADDPTKTDRWQCILCFACVKACPTGARQMRDPFLCSRIQELHQTCQQRKEPEFFL